MTPEGGYHWGQSRLDTGVWGTEASSFRNLDRMDFPRFNLLGSPVA